MASMDRIFASSREARRREWSSPKIALRFIIGNAVFWFIMYLQVIGLFEINTGNKCGPRLGTCAMYFSIYLSIDSGILPTFFMLLFGLLTIKNIHQTRRRIKATATTNPDQSVQASIMSKKEMQLHKMLANQIGLYLILNVANPFYFIYRAFTVVTLKSPLRVTAESFVNNLTYDLIYLGFALSFANFAVSSEMFRREFQLLIQTKIIARFRQCATTVEGTPARIIHAVN
ncbi:unnamed protein product [Adineta steineri]|uniref:G-protein coupled receptors family 1 profile domain-containing protein n=1 Tax=Adineta steineri TaxID=433720 RepID=A0A818Y3F7_9BILA|nr:unnamed protein product [Adineta steineri]CAF3744779.1 unnamed protein product [Adineta steineri]